MKTKLEKLIDLINLCYSEEKTLWVKYRFLLTGEEVEVSYKVKELTWLKHHIIRFFHSDLKYERIEILNFYTKEES